MNAEREIDQLGPVDCIVVEFPDRSASGEVSDERA
jgi:hypothetical protein